MTEKTITCQSAKLFYRTIGKGSPVVLLHGFGEDGDIWTNQVGYLKDHYQLIVPDLPGSGRSDLIDDMSIEGMAGAVKEIILHELPASAEQVRVIGHSMGGYITLALAEQFPEFIHAIGLVHSSAYADDDAKKASRLKSIEFIKANGAYEFLKTAIPGLFGPVWTPGHEDAIEALIQKGKQLTPAALIKYYQAMIARPERTAVLSNFSGPVLFIMGEHDKAVPFEQSIRQTPLINLAYIYILRNSAHMGMWEESEKVNEALLYFLNAAT